MELQPSRNADLNLSGYDDERNNRIPPRPNFINGPATLDLETQLHKLGKVRESLYSQNGWSSTNVNQDSKWDVGESTTEMKGNESRNVKRSFDTGTKHWSGEAPHMFASNHASYSGTGPMPCQPEFLYDDAADLAKRSGVESILCESEPVKSPQKRHLNYNPTMSAQYSGHDPMNAHVVYNAENVYSLNLNYSTMNPQYGGFDPQYTGYDSMGQHSFNNDFNSINNDMPLHSQLQNLNINQGFNAQLTEPNLNSVATTYPAAATRQPNRMIRGSNPMFTRMQQPSTAAAQWTAPNMNQFQPMPYQMYQNPMCSTNSNFQHYNNINHAAGYNGSPQQFPSRTIRDGDSAKEFSRSFARFFFNK